MSTWTYVKAANFKLFDLKTLCTLKTYPRTSNSFHWCRFMPVTFIIGNEELKLENKKPFINSFIITIRPYMSIKCIS